MSTNRESFRIPQIHTSRTCTHLFAACVCTHRILTKYRSLAQGQTHQNALWHQYFAFWHCLITHGCANFIRDRFFCNSDQYRIHICERCGLTAQSNLKKMTYECRTPTCVGRPYKICQVEIPYACKLLFQELQSMCISPRIYTEVRDTRDNSY